VKRIGQAADQIGVSDDPAVGVDPEALRRDVEERSAPGPVDVFRPADEKERVVPQEAERSDAVPVLLDVVVASQRSEILAADSGLREMNGVDDELQRPALTNSPKERHEGVGQRSWIGV
jgi:hypothetical protein